MKTPKNSATAAPFAYEGLDRVIHERARLSILTSLMTHPHGLSFLELKQMCALTDGNLARHLQVLEEDGMVKLGKEEISAGGRVQTTARITPAGRKRFLEYLTTLEQVVRDAAAAVETPDEDLLQRKLAPQGA
ncbi:transcriptional regulator [Terriglobus tenax]|uniref:transcriptional regulator n=1 Tax=Terriglobus tenax TaxID=1111115 RepID=UPI0021E03949|nr:transcriptional regulator [Terriglobus tenax]